LIVDDDKNAREGLQRYFQSLGAEVLIAESADSGYSALSEFKPDILLCDIAMPETDGYSLIQRIRALEPDEGGRTPAVAVTAYATAEDARRVKVAKFDLHVAKPVDPAVLSHIIAKLTG